MSLTLFHHSGAGEGDWTAEKIMVALREVGFDPRLVERGTKGWKKAVKETDGFVAVAGGDGTVAKVANLVYGTDLPLAILPTGSGNNIARSLGVMAPLEEIFPRLKHARSGPLRLCTATGSFGEKHFVEGYGLGALAYSVLELQEEKLDGDEKLIRGRDSLISSIEAQEPLDVEIRVDGQVVEGDFLLVEILNLPMIGPNIRFVPDTALKGDSLSVALLPEAERGAIVEWLSQGGAGVGPFRHIQGRVIDISGAPQPLRFDDKTRVWDGARVRFEAEPGRVQVLRPSDPK